MNQIIYRSGSWIDSLTFVTNKGTRSQYYGGGGGSLRTVTVPDGYRIVGFYGTYDNSYVLRLGFTVAKLIYTSCASGVGMILIDQQCV